VSASLADGDRPGGEAVESAADAIGGDGDGVVEDGEEMLLNSAFARRAREQMSGGKKQKQKDSKSSTRPTPTPTCQLSKPSLPSFQPAAETKQEEHSMPAANEDRRCGGIRMPSPIPLSSAAFSAGQFSNGGAVSRQPPAAMPKRPSIRPLLSENESPSGSSSPPPRPMRGGGAGRGLMTIFAHEKLTHPPPPPAVPCPRLPSPLELRNRPPMYHTGQDDQQQSTPEEWPR